MLSGSSFRTRIAYDIAVRYATPLWRAGAAFRGGCVCGLWVLLAWFPAGVLPRAAAQMLMVSAGAGLAWVQTQPGLLDRLASGRIAALRKTAWHLRILDERLHRFDGAVVAEQREGGGTRVLAR
jgi:hypothetical protein